MSDYSLFATMAKRPGLALSAADDGSMALTSADELGRRKFSSDGMGLSAKAGEGTALAATTGTGQGLRGAQGKSGGMNMKGMATIAGMMAQSYADDQAAVADQAQRSIRPVEWREPERSNLGAELMISSKKLKVPAKRGLGAIQRGRQGLDPIDANGVRMMNIQEKVAYAKELRSKLAKLKAKKGAR